MPLQKKCRTCHVAKDIDAFGTRTRNTGTARAGDPNDDCQGCSEKKKSTRQARDLKRKAMDKEGGTAHEEVRNMELADFITLLQEVSDNETDLKVCVDVGDDAPKAWQPKERANRIKEIVEKSMQLHWT